ncbi:AAA family ATPase [Microbulbifer taiwanensis]|uniref:AAA family ATPase n=1 Tax=Microbulbifer taiwanensis TaxID=986746 RepID=UPI003605CE32
MKGDSSSKRKPLRLIAVSDLIQNIRPVEWLVEGFIEQQCLALMFGDPGCGKSFIAVDIACSVATGRPWFGRRVSVPGV